MRRALRSHLPQRAIVGADGVDWGVFQILRTFVCELPEDKWEPGRNCAGEVVENGNCTMQERTKGGIMRATRIKAVAVTASLSMAATGFALASTGASAATAVKFGTLASPCGGGSPSGSPDTGVTASTIKLGYGDDAGYNQTNFEMHLAVAALIKWCNAQGGINGRKIAGDYQDAAIFNAKSAVDKAIANGDFMLAGQGWAFDSAAEADRLAADLVSVPGFTASTDTQNAWEMYQGMPNPADYAPASSGYEFAKLFPTQVKAACAFRTDDLPGGASKTSDLKNEYVFTAAGWKFMEAGGKGQKTSPSDFNSLGCDQNVDFYANVGAPSTINNASLALKNAGAKTVFWSATYNGILTDFLADNAANHYSPLVLVESSSYDAKFAKNNKKGYYNSVYARIAFEPIEAANAVPAVKQLENLVGGAANDNQIGEQAASSFLLWATAAKSCGNNLTRQCVVNYLGNSSNFSGSKAWTAGGLQGGTNPATNLPASCGILMHLSGTKWVQAYPAKLGSFDCASKYQADTTPLLPFLPNSSGTGITLINRHDGSGSGAIKPQ